MQADAAEVKATFLKNILVLLLKGIIAALRQWALLRSGLVIFFFLLIFSSLLSFDVSFFDISWRTTRVTHLNALSSDTLRLSEFPDHLHGS